MYDFKHKINNHQRFNTYELSIQESQPQSNSYEKLRNGLFFVILILTAFIIGAFSQKRYQSYQKSSQLETLEIREMKTTTRATQRVAHLKLTKAITNSVVNNLQANRHMENINYNELKRIIKKVVIRIQSKPNTIEAI